MMRFVAFLVLAATFLMPSNLFGQDENKVVTVDHFVPHTSKVPANASTVVTAAVGCVDIPASVLSYLVSVA